jgi:iduronate 2-sulfatase
MTLFTITSTTGQGAKADLKNVLMLIVDDFRPEIVETYGASQAVTPNMDSLAREGVVFQRAYCQATVCGPSRSSFMTGRRPPTSKLYGFGTNFRQDSPGGSNWTTMPGWFKANGYMTIGGGKTFHPHLPKNYDPQSWSADMKYPL